MNWYEPGVMKSVQSFLVVSLPAKGLPKEAKVELQYERKVRLLLLKERPDPEDSTQLQEALSELGLEMLWSPEVNDESLDQLALLVSERLEGYPRLVNAVAAFQQGKPEQLQAVDQELSEDGDPMGGRSDLERDNLLRHLRIAEFAELLKNLGMNDAG